MSYQVLARKWRPQTFEEIVGQEHVTQTLSNALSRGRVAHAYLFTGPRGCGKTTMARLMAKALNCDEPKGASPCGKCPSCVGIAGGNFLDVLEIDAASNTGVDNIRELRENAQYQPSAGKKRVFIIDEVHMLSKGAFNALLKILEEPPEHVHFVFATTEPVRIPRTILSRCQRFDFRLFSLRELSDRIAEITADEKTAISPEAIELLASLAEGSMRDALSLLDQAIASTEGELSAASVLALFGLVGHEVYLDLNDAILARDARAALDIVDGLVNGGHDLVEFARGLVGNFRDLSLLRLDASLAERIDKPEAIRTRLAEQAQNFVLADLIHLTQRSAEHYSALERAPQPRWLMEAQVMEYVTLESRVLLSEVLGRLDGLGQGGESTRPATPPAPRPSKPKKSAAPAPPAVAKAPRPAAKAAPATPAPEASRERPAAATTRDPEWARFVAAVRQQDIAVGTCLVEAVPRWEDGDLVVVFRPEHGFHRDQVGQREVLGRLGTIAQEVFDRKITLRVDTDHRAEEEDAMQRRVQEKVAPDQKQRLQKRAQENPHLGRLLDSLGGSDKEES